MPQQLFSLLLLAALLQGCPSKGQTLSDGGGAAKSERMTIVVTTAMVGDLVRHVAGEHADVLGLMGEGVDPHLFRPTANDVGHMMTADLIFYSGLMLEGAMEQAFKNAANNGKQVSAVTSELPKDYLSFPEEFQGHPDPHVWNDPAAWHLCLDHIVDVLSKAKPQLSEEFRANAVAYREEIKQVDAYVKKIIATIPEEQRYLVTAHDAFAYFGRANGIEVKSVQGITTESESGVQDINNLVAFLVEKKIPAIFIEATVNEANMRAVMEGAGQKGWQVRIGGTLYSDSMGQAGTYEGTYIGMIDHNATTVTRALGGTAPEKGMLGKLDKK